MTRNQLLYQQNLETERANRAREAENLRSNLAKERENLRSNVAKERETHRSNKATESISRGKIYADFAGKLIPAGANLAGAVLKLLI